MDKAKLYTANSEQWDKQELGADEQYVKRSDANLEQALDEALSLQMISIRLQKQMIEDLKVIARAHGIGYQPLIRDVLSRFVTHELKQIMRDTLERRELEAQKLQQAYAEADLGRQVQKKSQKKVA